MFRVLRPLKTFIFLWRALFKIPRRVEVINGSPITHRHLVLRVEIFGCDVSFFVYFLDELSWFINVEGLDEVMSGLLDRETSGVGCVSSDPACQPPHWDAA